MASQKRCNVSLTRTYVTTASTGIACSAFTVTSYGITVRVVKASAVRGTILPILAHRARVAALLADET